MWNNRNKPRKLAHEILGLIALSAVIAAVAFLLLSGVASAALEEYFFRNDVPMTEFDWIRLDRLVFGTAGVLAICVFSAVFLAMLSGRMAYIRKLTAGIDALRDQQAQPVQEQGNNELTQLAQTINALTDHQKRVKEKEIALTREKEELIRSLSHDIRTPLTSLMTYAEYLAQKENGISSEGKKQLSLIRSKAEQIRELTDLLLDGSKQNLEFFEDGRLLFAQLAEEFSEALEQQFDLRAELTALPAFSGSFDVRQLRRIFDNLSSNIQKYADPAKPVYLSVHVQGELLVIRQENAIRPETGKTQGFGIGLQSIRRIANNCGGSVEVNCEKSCYFIKIALHL